MSKNGFANVLQFFSLISDGLGGVILFIAQICRFNLLLPTTSVQHNSPLWFDKNSTRKWFLIPLLIQQKFRFNRRYMTACNRLGGVHKLRWQGEVGSWYWKYQHWADFTLTLIGMRQGGFTSLIILGLDFVGWILIKNFQTFWSPKWAQNWYQSG